MYARAPILRSTNFYTATVYEKGAEVIRVLKSLIGDDAFDRGMQLYSCAATAQRRRSKISSPASRRPAQGFARVHAVV
ncbi:MAG: M1 family aminopeptidase [Alphaproteobacteria bacterium]